MTWFEHRGYHLLEEAIHDAIDAETDADIGAEVATA